MADVSSDLSASDPGCVREIGRTANGVQWRNPDGTVTTRQYPSDVNYRAADGSWQAIDTRLVSDGQGGTVNKAGTFKTEFAGRADADNLVRLETEGTSLSFGFDGAAQSDSAQPVAPTHVSSAVSDTADADTLMYTNVLSNVDLEYQVLSDTLKEALVLHGPLPEGVSPQFSFSVQLDGLRAQTAEDGTIQFVNASSGVVAFSIPAGLALDASGDADKGIDPATTPVTVALVPGSDPSVATLVVSIDNKWLSDPARKFPVTIDPSFTNGVWIDAYVSDTAPTTNYNGAGQYNSGAGQYWDRAGNPGGTNYRSFQYYPSVSWLQPYKIVSASWWGYAYSVGGGTGIPIHLDPINGYWDVSGVNWNNQPAVRTSNKSASYSAGNQWRSVDVTTWVANWADGTWGQDGIRFTGPAAKYANIAAQEAPSSVRSYIQITYDAYPYVSRLSAGGQYAAANVKTHTPTLSAQVDDTDTSSGLLATYQVWNASHTTMLASGNGTTIHTGERSGWTAPTLSDGTYTWRVAGYDGTVQTAWTSWQTFTVDSTAPAPPAFGSGMPAQNTWWTGTSLSASFIESPYTDGYAFLWGIDVGNNPTEFDPAWIGTFSTGAVPLASGWHDLAVRTVDWAGNISSVVHYAFGLNDGGFITPQPDFTTQSGVTTQVVSKPSYDGVALQWRHSESDTWQTVPAGDVTYQSNGAGISAWPVTTTPGTYSSSFPSLVWDAASTTGGVDGPLQMRSALYTSGVVQAYSASTLNGTLNQTAFGGGFASAPAGPGQVNLLTGNLALDATDVQSPAGAVTRTFQSLNENATGSVFGPGWTSNLLIGDSQFQSLVDNGDYATVISADGSQLSFRQETGGAYLAPDGSSDLTLTKVSASRFELARLNSQTFGFTNYDGNATTRFLPSDVTDPTSQTATMSWALDSGTGLTRPAQMLAPTPAGINCSTNPLTTRGCRTITFDYATSTTATGTSSSQWGDYLGQLTTIHYTAWDPDLSIPAMTTVDVATYSYDDNGRLRAAWNPRISPALKTTYSYDTNGHVATITPPGEEAWTFGYAPLSGEPVSTGRLGTVSRPTLPSGTATSTFVYQIPLTTAAGGPYNLDTTTVASWAQHDVPTNATAIYPPDQTPSGTPPSSYTRAAVTYMNVQGQAVNGAQPGGYVTSSEHDQFGNEIRTLSAANRQRALSSSSSATAQAAMALLLDTQTVYDASGLNVTDTYGPAHVVDLPDQTARSARQHVHSTYDEGAPSGGPYNLVTTKTDSAVPTDGSAEQDVRTTSYAYAIGADNSGWTLGTPLRTTVDPGSSPHLNLATTTLYDAAIGNLTARRLPANPSGGDAHETLSIYYTAGINTQDSACGNRPEWANLPCKTLPAAQPGTSGLPDIPITQVTKYNLLQQAEESTATNGSDNRTTTISYDAAGRQTTQAIASTSGTSLPNITTTFDSSTGRASSASDGTLTISRTYDTLGRLTDYYDADGDHTQYTYDDLDRPILIGNGKATTTYSYDNVGGEHRGLPTTIADPVAGDFTATYDADGNLATQTYPGSLTATYTYNQAGQPTDLVYSKSTGTWPASPATYNVHGQRTTGGNSLESLTYGYDAAGRLTNATDAQAATCIQRQYSFDADTNRTELVSTTTGGAGNTNPCLAGGGSATTTNQSYDAADRLTTSGYSYDAFGRTTAVAASDSASGVATSLGYYSTDFVNTMTTDGATTTYQLDPARRIRNWSSSADGEVHTNHYATDADTAAWSSENTAGTSWVRNIVAVNGLTATVTDTSVVTLALTNVHGDIFSTVPSTASDWLSSSTWTATEEYGTPTNGASTTGTRYDYLGTAQRQRDTRTGLQLMGARVFNAKSGRFLQKDPLEGGSCNDYDYTCADPVNSVDVTGQNGTCQSPTRFGTNFICILTNRVPFPCGFLYYMAHEHQNATAILINLDIGGKGWIKYGGDANHCSLGPDAQKGIFDFKNACDLHDLGYDLLRFFQRSNRTQRSRVDRLFHAEMKASCNSFWWAYADCRGVALLYFSVVQANSARQHWGVP